MGWLLLIILPVLLLGPLRRWVGRHWALLISAVVGGILGLVLGSMLIAKTGGPAFLPLLWAAAGAIVLGQSGPAWLRKIERDGKDERSSRRH